MAHIIVAIVAVAAIFLVGRSWQTQSRFHRDYADDGAFVGSRYECALGGLNLEGPMLCMIGADPFRLYLLPHPKPRGPFGRFQFNVLKQALSIPWRDIECRKGRVSPVRTGIWFRIESRRVFLHVSKEIGAKLLADAHRPIPD